MRLDVSLAGKPEIKSRALGQKLIEAGLVRVNGRKIRKASFDVSTSDTVEWDELPKVEVPKEPKSTVKLPVLFEDDFCMVIEKPAGVTVHPGSGTGPGEETILSALKPLFAKRKLPFSDGEVLVHRLDKETTGCLLIAKTPKAHMALQKQFADRTVEKRYLTLVDGIPDPVAAVIDAPIGRHTNQRTKMSVHQASASRAARTTYRTLGTAKKAALLECELHTGRTHQIRVHLRSVEHPVLGDTSYGTNSSQQMAEKYDINCLCLHAWKLSFKSPSGDDVSVKCAIPALFLETLKKLEIAAPK